MEKFFAKYGKPKYAFKMIDSELHDAKHALKDGALPTNREIFAADITDKDFLDLYEKYIDDTFPNELAEAIVKIMDLADSYGYDLKEYIPLVDRYCALKSPKTAGTKLLVRYV